MPRAHPAPAPLTYTYHLQPRLPLAASAIRILKWWAHGGEAPDLPGFKFTKNAKGDWAAAVLRAAAPDGVVPRHGTRTEEYARNSVRRAAANVLARYEAA